MKISFTIIKALAVEAVKSETYIKGSIDVASNQGATKLGFNETAGDIEVHERKLSKDFVRGVERLKAIYVDFFIPDHKTVMPLEQRMVLRETQASSSTCRDDSMVR